MVWVPLKALKKEFLESSENLLRYIIKVVVFDKEKTAFILKEIPTAFEVMLGLRFEGLVGV